MKWIVIILFLALNHFPAQARERQLLQCLGAEEKRFHLAKATGPFYDLNQKIIAEMVQIPNAELSSSAYDRICNSKTYSESLKLLELTLKEGRSIFVLADVTGIQKDMTLGMIDDYLEATKEILLNFISQIQTISPTPHCLQEEIPELDKFFTEIKYLQEDVDIKTIFKNRELSIFDKIKLYPKAFKNCQLRLKKKLKSESTAPAKKP